MRLLLELKDQGEEEDVQSVTRAQFFLYIHVNQKLKIMIYEFIMMKDRVPYLVEEFKDEVTVGEDWKENMSFVKIEINYGSDLVKLFHAGLKYGMDEMRKIS